MSSEAVREGARGLACRVTVVLIGVAFVASVLVLPPASASTIEEAVAVDGGVRLAQMLNGPGFRLWPGADEQATPAGKRYYDMRSGVWLWPEGNRGYFLDELATDASLTTAPVCCGFQPLPYNTAHNGWNALVAMDLESGEELGRARLDPPGLYSAAPGFPTASPPELVAVDAAGRLFVAHGELVTRSIVGSEDPVEAAQADIYCRHGNQSACFEGFHVLDARTLEPVAARIDFQRPRVDGTPLDVTLRGSAFFPADAVLGQSAKLVAVVEQMVGDTTHADASPRRFGAGQVWAVQFDADTGRQEWMVRLDACRGRRAHPDGTAHAARDERPGAMSLMRTARDGAQFLVVGCHAGGTVGVVVEVPLDADGVPYAVPVQVGDSEAVIAGVAEAPTEFRPAPGDLAGTDGGQRVFNGPENTVEHYADQASGRLLMRVVDLTNAEVWWVFDTRRWELLGTIGIGAYGSSGSASALDPATGRLYVMGSPSPDAAAALYIADIRRDPLPQALVFADLGQYHTANTYQSGNYWMSVAPASQDTPARVFARQGPANSSAPVWAILEDRLPSAVLEDSAQTDPFAGRTLDLDERDGVTSSSADGAARGYGFRALLVGGAEAAARTGPIDPVGQAQFGNELGQDQYEKATDATNQRSPAYFEKGDCLNANREVVVGFVGPDGPAVVDASGTRGGAEPIRLDERTKTDMELPITRCAADWSKIWKVGLFGNDPVAEPKVGWLIGTRPVECLGDDEAGNSDRTGDPVGQSFAAAVDCQDGEASGFAYGRGATVNGVSVMESMSSFRIYRDPERGIVSRVESVARGVGVEGVVRIESVRGTAESWANGRRQPVPAEERPEGYDANCDRERTAGTCFQRQVMGVWTPGYACGPCGDEARLLEGLNRAMGVNGKARFREPNPVLANGADNGFAAAVSKPDFERFSDLVLNNDLLQTVVPTLEIVRITQPGRVETIMNTTQPRGRQVYQFAGVEVSSSYAIQCLLVYDEATNVCAAPTEAPGAITVSLSDPDGEPLAGGAFEIRSDVDADGLVGLADTLLPEGACVTTDDGVGTCSFDSLQPGSYLVTQTAAPAGYAKSMEPFVVELASGEQRTVAFTNVSNVSTIDLAVADESGAPLAGASFAAYPDPDSDGKVAPDAQPAAQCTTDASGVCTMQVPAGSYVLVQTAAPAGLEGIEPVAFSFASGGQVAAVTVVNYPPDSPAQPDAPASPVYTPPVDQAPPVESVDDYVPPADTVDIAPEPAVSLPDQIGGTVVQVIRAPGDALRLLARDPKQAAAWIAAIALFCLAVTAIRRRQQALQLLAP